MRNSVVVSIHAPQEGCDCESFISLAYERGFNSRTPGGVRPSNSQKRFARVLFQFTHPRRGATRVRSLVILTTIVSIHAPQEGCDRFRELRCRWDKRFNSRTPGGVRRQRGGNGQDQWRVSIHAPQEGCDGPECSAIRGNGVSFHAPLEGCDRRERQSAHLRQGFNSRTPGGVRLIPLSALITLTRFNSRTPGGVRQYGAKLPIMGRINKRNLRLAVLL